MAVATGAIIGLAALPVIVGGAIGDLAWLPALALFLVALHPRIANPGLSLLFRWLRRPLERPLSWQGLGTASLWQSAGWVLLAVPVILTSRDLGADGPRLIAIGIGAFALSWVAGFLFVLAPAGAGVREVVMTALLSTAMSPASALTVALLSRLMMTFGDVIVGIPALGAVGRRRLLAVRLQRGSPADGSVPALDGGDAFRSEDPPHPD
jgi:uncharacterized membrane protein YbhN (UPF0104 family)